ncbi:MAG: hypothetical protein [Cotesia congregata filamentous virus 2]
MGIIASLFETEAQFEQDYFDNITNICSRISKSCSNFEIVQESKIVCNHFIEYKAVKELFDIEKNKDNYMKMVRVWPETRDALFNLVSKLSENYFNDFIVVRLYDFVYLQHKILKYYANIHQNINLKESCERKLIRDDNSIDNNIISGIATISNKINKNKFSNSVS